VKKLLTSLIAGCVLFSVVAISGCGKKEDKKETKTTTETKTTETKEK
jgi:hypothetical protein